MNWFSWNIITLGASTGAFIAFLSGCTSSVAKRPITPLKDAEWVGGSSGYHPLPAGSARMSLAVKDLIDVRGSVTTAGSQYLQMQNTKALKDAKCLQYLAQSNFEIVGKTNLTEFAVTVSGLNEYFGNPVNPVNPDLISGGSSSGSAVAVAKGLARVALGTDTAGSIRVPAACCRIFGLKTTFQAARLEGVYPLSPQYLDTVGPMARSVSDLVLGMSLLEPDTATKYANLQNNHNKQIKIAKFRVGSFSPPFNPLNRPATDKTIQDEIDLTLTKLIQNNSNISIVDVLQYDQAFEAEWNQAEVDGQYIAGYDALQQNGKYLDKQGVSKVTKDWINTGSGISESSYESAILGRDRWVKTLEQLFTQIDFIVLPTLQTLPPKTPNKNSKSFEQKTFNIQNTLSVNLAGNPAISVPAPYSTLPIGIQVIGPLKGEAEILSIATQIEQLAKRKER